VRETGKIRMPRTQDFFISLLFSLRQGIRLRPQSDDRLAMQRRTRNWLGDKLQQWNSTAGRLPDRALPQNGNVLTSMPLSSREAAARPDYQAFRLWFTERGTLIGPLTRPMKRASALVSIDRCWRNVTEHTGPGSAPWNSLPHLLLSALKRR
jgi:hypothetical protein